MECFNESRLRELAAHRECPSVSLYIPTTSPRNLHAAAEDRNRFRSLAAIADQRLMGRGVQATAARRMMESLRNEVESMAFWRQFDGGLAAFISPYDCRVFSLPEPPPEKVVVAERFVLKPLLSYLGRRGRFYVLALGENLVKLFAGDRYELDSVDAPRLPENFEDSIHLEMTREAISVMTASTPVLGRRSWVFGQKGARAQRQHELETYLRAVERAAYDLLVGESVPLVFAGASSLFPQYRAINQYAYLLGECIAGDADLYSHEELRRRAWTLVEPFYARSQEVAAAQFIKFYGTERASSDTRELVFAAQAGLIDSLFVALDAEQWGLVDWHRRTVKPAGVNQLQSEELLDYVAVQTFLNRGMVYVVDRRQVPGGGPVAATYRTPVIQPLLSRWS
jgi:hypothetical protein